MRPGQNRRMRGRNNAPNGGGGNRKAPNPLQRSYESNGPDVKVRGTAQHIAEKYLQLARDAQASGDPVAAESYWQHAEHYLRLIAAAHEQYRQANPSYRPYEPSQDQDDEDMDEPGPYSGGPQNQPQNQPQPEARFPVSGEQDGDFQPRFQQREQREFQPRPPREQREFQPRDQQPRENREFQPRQPRE